MLYEILPPTPAFQENLLDNSDFTQLIYQAGIGGNHGTVAYAADRWILVDGTVSYQEGVGLTLKGTIQQKLLNVPQEPYVNLTLASGTADARYLESNNSVFISSSDDNCVLKNIGLYEGPNLQPYRPKGKGIELANCQIYFRKIVNVQNEIPFLSGYITGGALNCVVSLFPLKEMRTTPILAYNNISMVVRGIDGYISNASFTAPYTAPIINLRYDNNTPIYLDIKRTKGDKWGGTNNTPVEVVFNVGSEIYLIADL